MGEKTNLFDRFTVLMDQNLRGIQIGVYSVALLGLGIAIRSVRPFSKFKKPSDIPNGFIKARMKLNGTVDRIEPSGCLLMVRHKPLVPLFITSSTTLPVKVAGVNVTGHGLSWLQSVVAGNEITFVPVLKKLNYVESEVNLKQLTHDKKVRILNVGEALVSVGFGQVNEIEKPLQSDPNYLHYYNILKAAALKAEKKRLGWRYYVQPTKQVSQRLTSKLITKLKQLITQPKPTKRTSTAPA